MISRAKAAFQNPPFTLSEFRLTFDLKWILPRRGSTTKTCTCPRNKMLYVNIAKMKEKQTQELQINNFEWVLCIFSYRCQPKPSSRYRHASGSPRLRCRCTGWAPWAEVFRLVTVVASGVPPRHFTPRGSPEKQRSAAGQSPRLRYPGRRGSCDRLAALGGALRLRLRLPSPLPKTLSSWRHGGSSSPHPQGTSGCYNTEYWKKW